MSLNWIEAGSISDGSSSVSLMSSVSALLRRVRMPRRPGRGRVSRQSRGLSSRSAEVLENRLLLFALGARWSTTATNGSGLGQGDATTVTWSIVPDGTPIPALSGLSGESSDPSNLVAFLNGIYGTVTNDTNYTDEIWFPHFQSTFDRWSELSGITYVYVPYDDGAAFSSFAGAAPGVLGVRADVRIGGHRIDGNSGVLAYNFYPNNGEMVIDTADTNYPSTGNSIRLRNVLAHESGHGLGLQHVISSNAAFLMEGNLSQSFDGPQFDDILGLQRHYGDYYEKNGGNDTANKATPLGTLSSGQTLTIGADAHSTAVSVSMTDFVSIDDESDIDFFSFTVSAAGSVSINLTPMGPTYLMGPQGGSESSFNASAQSDLALTLFDRNGSTILVTANNTGLGGSEAINGYFLPAAGTYYARVTGSTLNKIQMYKLDISSDVPASPELSIADVTVNESAGTATFTVSLNTVAGTDVSFNYATSNNTALAGSDYVSTSGSRTIPAGQSSTSFTVQILDDNLHEPTETFFVTISNPVGAAIARATATATITDNDALALTVVVNPATFSEGAGASAATGTVTRNNSDLSASVVVNLSSSDTTEATTPTTVTIPAGQASATFAIAAVDDAVVDGSQTVTITAAATSHVSGTANVTVTDNDVLTLTLMVNPGTFSEAAGSSAATGTVTRNSADLSSSLVVNLSSSDTTEATVASTVIIPAGQSSATFIVSAVDDAIVDGSQSVTIIAAAASYVSGTTTVIVTDNDVLTLTLTVNPGTFSEGAGSQAATGTVTRNNADLSSSLVVNLSSSDTTEATVPTTVTIPAGQSSATFFIAAVDDAIVDGSQLVTITAAAASYLSGTADVTVTDNDAPTLTVTVTPGTFSEAAGASAATGTVTRNTADLSTALVVNLSSSDTTEATVSSSVTIPVGQSSATFTIAAVDDAIVDGSQTVTITAAAATFTSGTANVTVTDNDVLTLTLSVNPGTFSEAAGSSAATGTVTRNSADLSSSLVVNLSSSDTTEATVASTVIIPAGQSSATFVVSAVDDAIVDGPQVATITASAGSYISGTANVTVTDNDVMATPTITQPGSKVNTQRPLISWTTSPSATSYEIWIANQSTGTNPYYLATVSETSHIPSMDLGIGVFNLWIRARNEQGISAWTPQYQFRVQTRAKIAAGNRFQETYRPTLDWEAVPGAVRYDVWIDNHSAGISQYIRNQNVTGTSFTPEQELPIGIYRAWVSAIAADGLASDWSFMQEYYVIPAPVITQGMNSTFDRTPTFAWEPSIGAVRYEVFIHSQSLGQTVVYDQQVLDTTWTASAALPDGPYRWWALAVGANNVRSYWTAPMDIYIGGRSQVLTPSGSTDQATPTFTWKEVDGAVRYELWADRIGVQVAFINETQLTGTSFTPSLALPAGNYRVWIRAVSETNEFSPWSVQLSFTIVADSEPLRDSQGPVDQLLTGLFGDELQQHVINRKRSEDERLDAFDDRTMVETIRHDESTPQLIQTNSDASTRLEMEEPLKLAELWMNSEALLNLLTVDSES